MGMMDKWRRLGEEMQLKSGSILILPGIVPNHCYYIESGIITAYIENDNGLKHAYGFFQDGDVFLEQDLLRGRACDLYYETVGKVQVRKISKLQIEQALKEEPRLYEDILKAVMKFGDSLLEQSINQQNGNAASRVSNLFLDLARTYGIEKNGNVIIDLKLSQELVSQLTGLHRITVAREMKKMQERSLILRQVPRYVIPSVEKLTEYRNQQRGVFFDGYAGGMRQALQG